MNQTFQPPCGALKPDFSQFFGHISGLWQPFGNRWADFALQRVQSPAKDRRHSRQIVSSQGKNRLSLHFGQSNKTDLAKATYRLRPTKYFFNSFAQVQADAVTGMSGRPSINGAVCLLGNMWGHASLPRHLDETSGVVILVGTQGRTPFQRAFGHHLGRFTLGLARRQHRFHINCQASPVFHQGMAHEAELELGLVALGLLEQAGILIRGRGMLVVLALFTRKIDRHVAATTFRRLAGTIVSLKAFRRRPSFIQRTIDREMLGRDQSVPPCQTKHFAEEGASHRFVEQVVTILRETAVIPHLVIHIKTDKPAIEQLVVNVLEQLTLETNQVQRLDQTGAQEMLRQNRRAPHVRVEHFEVNMHCRQNAIHQHPQFTQSVLRRNPLFQCPVAEYLRWGHVGAAHEISITLNLKDRLCQLHEMGGGFRRPVNVIEE